MADLCRQCSIATFGSDSHDLGWNRNQGVLQDEFGFPALCEGCGVTRVDYAGQCLDGDSCLGKCKTPEKIYRTWEEAEKFLNGDEMEGEKR
jgi:hypothetical protein